ncbi:MAG: EVE domain-containing protein [Sedimentisphaerales bacterium]|jgi:predicted RNA-binding protein|nr:EVE domain-containing protein [Sedimentisphaerales bacterium]
MQQYWLVVGSQKNWEVAFKNRNIWGLKDFREIRSLWNMLREGDGVLFYVAKPVHGIVGFGHVASKFKQTQPLWPEEVARNEVLWPLRFEFDIEYCLPQSLWRIRKYTTQDLQLITRMVFQCFSVHEVDAARIALGIRPIQDTVHAKQLPPSSTTEERILNHTDLKSYLSEIGRIQGYVTDKEYPLNGTYLDVVWRRVERSVPTFAFEVQIGGDIYHAMAKLKHAFDLWNSHIFLVAAMADKPKYDELLSGTFHEVSRQMHFFDATTVRELLEKKNAYREMERSIGILPI